jgi:hypothetical protein
LGVVDGDDGIHSGLNDAHELGFAVARGHCHVVRHGGGAHPGGYQRGRDGEKQQTYHDPDGEHQRRVSGNRQQGRCYS